MPSSGTTFLATTIPNLFSSGTTATTTTTRFSFTTSTFNTQEAGAPKRRVNLHDSGSQVVKGRVNLHSGDWKRSPGMETLVENMTKTEAGDHNQPSPKLLTLVIVRAGDKVLLGMKKRGFGAGYYNGFGGKVEPGETIHDAAVRELHEESAVTPLSMEKRGILTFHFDDNPQPWEVHVFHVGEYSGEPCETDEMAPTWFSLGEIPYKKMWQDDPIWYPEFLGGRCFKGEFYFHNTHTLVSHSLHVVPTLDA